MTEKQNWVWVLMRRYHHRGLPFILLNLGYLGLSVDIRPGKILKNLMRRFVKNAY